MNNQLIMQSLPMVAAVLGNQYGVTVNIGGKEAFTNGQTINLPALPMDCDATLLGLARGYIDHESAHIRHTDFKAIKDAQLTSLEHHIMNSIEDWRIENKLVTQFPGCRGNFKWLIKHFFAGGKEEGHESVSNMVANLVLLTVRSWDVKDVEKPRDRVLDRLKNLNSDLAQKLVDILEEVRKACVSTADSVVFAKRIAEFLETEVKQIQTGVCSASIRNKAPESPNSLESPVVDANQDLREDVETTSLGSEPESLPKQLGELLLDSLSIVATQTPVYKKVEVATVGDKRLHTFPQNRLSLIHKAENNLKTRLGRLLQSQKLKRTLPSRTGKVQPQYLARTALSSPKVFCKPQASPAINTAVHILLDGSGSMHRRIGFTAEVCYALTKALCSLQGINVGVTVFPTPYNDGVSVCPLLRHGEKLHPNFSVTAMGGTPMGPALWWVLQQIKHLSEPRKIVIVITDGAPDDGNAVRKVKRFASQLGVEMYGLGIFTDSVKTYFNQSSVISTLDELAPELFKLLSGALKKKQGVML